MQSYPEYVAQAIAKLGTPGADGDDQQYAFTHKMTTIPMNELAELPLGMVESAHDRNGAFELRPPTQEALGMMRRALASLPEARRKPGVAMAAQASCLIESMAGDTMPSRIGERAARFAQLTIGDAYTLIFRLQAERQGGSVELTEIDCPKCGDPFVPRLPLDDRPVNVYRQKLRDEPDPGSPGETRPVWGGLLPATETPHVAVKLRRPAQFHGREASALVMSPPTWMAACYGVAKVAWEDEDKTQLFESLVSASIVGDEHGPYPGPITAQHWRRSGLMAYDFDRLKVGAVAVAGGPPTLITIACPHGPKRPGDVGCEALLSFPVGWDVADDFFVLG